MKFIIHFTSTFDNLYNILSERKLNLKYCKEDFYLKDKNISKAAHPMVSFSEYSIKAIHKKRLSYGNFGIAFKKTWIMNNNIHPVLYVERNSKIADALATLLKERRSLANNLKPSLKLAIMEIKCYVKNTVGHNVKLKENNFDFKSENEWRFVPTKENIGNGNISLSQRKYVKEKNRYNKKLSPYPLGFSLDDVEYVFVKTNSQKEAIKKLINIKKIMIIGVDNIDT